MVRKWSYINQIFFKKSFIKNLKSRFTFKIFRKNTRFKNLNQGSTLFIRKLVVLQHRRIGWKPYFLIASLWLKYVLKLKKFIMFLQTTLLHNLTITYPYINMFFKKTYLLSLVGIGTHSINYVFIKNINIQNSHLPLSSIKSFIKTYNIKKKIKYFYPRHNLTL